METPLIFRPRYSLHRKQKRPRPAEDESVHFRGTTSIRPLPALRTRLGLAITSLRANGRSRAVLLTQTAFFSNLLLATFSERDVGKLSAGWLPFLSVLRLLTPPEWRNYNLKTANFARLFCRSRMAFSKSEM
jgi:hypothetical protein